MSYNRQLWMVYRYQCKPYFLHCVKVLYNFVIVYQDLGQLSNARCCTYVLRFVSYPYIFIFIYNQIHNLLIYLLKYITNTQTHRMNCLTAKVKIRYDTRCYFNVRSKADMS